MTEIFLCSFGGSSWDYPLEPEPNEQEGGQQMNVRNAMFEKMCRLEYSVSCNVNMR